MHFIMCDSYNFDSRIEFIQKDPIEPDQVEASKS